MNLPPEAFREVSFEGKKHAVRQLQSSEWQVTFTLHPSDIGKLNWLLMAPNGTQLCLTAVAATEDGSRPDPAQRQQETVAERAVMQAGLLCKQEKFQHYLEITSGDLLSIDHNMSSEDIAAERLRSRLQILSRRHLATNPEAQERFAKLLSEFMEFAKKETDI